MPRSKSGRLGISGSVGRVGNSISMLGNGSERSTAIVGRPRSMSGNAGIAGRVGSVGSSISMLGKGNERSGNGKSQDMAHDDFRWEVPIASTSDENGATVLPRLANAPSMAAR